MAFGISAAHATVVSLLCFLATPVLYRAAYLNHNLLVADAGFAALLLLWDPLDRPLTSGRAGLAGLRAALIIYGVASGACALAPNIELLLTARAVQALGSSGAIVLARAIVRDLYSGARAGRELSLMGAIMALAPVLAPMIGGVLQSAFGWRSHFILQIAFGLIAAFFVWRKLPETLKTPAPGPFSLRAIFAGYAEIMRNRAVLAYVGMLAVSFAGVFAWISGSCKTSLT